MTRANISIRVISATPHTTRILLKGQLVVSNAEPIKKEFLDALNRSENIELIFKNITKLDLTVIQLVIALQKSVLQLKKNLSFDLELSEHIKLLMENSGFVSLTQAKV